MIKRTTWVFVAFFIIILTAAILFQRNQNSIDAQTTPTQNPEILINHEANEIIFLSVENSAGEKVALELDRDGNWVFIEPESVEVDTPALDSVINQIGTLREVTKISTITSKEDFGLDQPAYKIKLRFVDGNDLTLNIGKITPTESGYYIDTGQQEILVVNKLGIDAITDLIHNPPVLEQVIPSPNP